MKKEKISFSEIMWLFIIGSVMGFFIESTWYLIKHGEWLNKQGLLYGPFKPIYGIGLILIVILMQNYKDKKVWQKFLAGVLIGSGFEYFCSLFLEYVLHTSTWNYATFKYNIAGRVYLPYALIWGILAVLCLDYFYPFFKKYFYKINNNVRKIATIVITLFMSINISLTFVAIERYTTRANNPNDKTVFKVIDKVYDDDYMEKKFPKHVIIKNN